VVYTRNQADLEDKRFKKLDSSKDFPLLCFCE